MCGINGFNWSDVKLIQSMNLAIKHRGPNGQGFFNDQSMSLGQVRLSILDLSEKGHQPMGLNICTDGKTRLIYKDDLLDRANIIIVFNGEIYNYQELRTELTSFSFESDCDTEVILKAYLQWGVDCVSKFDGMWAFVIYDLRKNILFCSRDRFGVKPFYYYNFDGKFIFSSEIKALLQHSNLMINRPENINQDALEIYFNSGFIPSPYSIFKNVNKLEGGHNLIFDLKEKKILQNQQYYELPKYNPIYDKKKLIQEGKNLLTDSVNIRLRSDVPLGVFLSGGLDSSTIVSEMSQRIDMAKLNTFSMGFEGKYDETPYINIVKEKFNTIHHHFYFKEENFLELMEKYCFYYDEPFGDYSGFPLLFLSKNTKPIVTVVLSGDGGDEIFGGYQWHKIGSRLDMLCRIPLSIRRFFATHVLKLPGKGLKDYFKRFSEACKNTLLDKKDFFAKATNYLDSPVFDQWAQEKLRIALEKGGNTFGEAFRIYDLLFGTLQDLFCVKVDRSSMVYALEVRSPFLDYRFAEFAQKIPTKWKQNAFKTKILMRDIIRPMLPKSIVYRNKQGFHPPIDNWILKDTYLKDLEASIVLMDKISPKIANFYKTKIFSEKIEQNEFINNFKIRLIIFFNWWKLWIENNISS